MCLSTPALMHINTAMELAIELGSADLQASTLYRSSAIHVHERNTLALADIDGALAYAQKARPHIRGAILVDAALVHATTDTGLAKETYSDAIKSTYNIKQAKRVFKHLAASPYGSAPEVVDLEMNLRGR